jgi:hypothetical protein
MFMACFYATFHMSDVSDSLVVATRMKAKENIGMAVMLFYIKQKMREKKLQTFPR